MARTRNTQTPSLSRRVVSVIEAGLILGISRWTVYRIVRSGELPSFPVNGLIKVDIDDIDAYIEKQKVNRRLQLEKLKADAPPKRPVGRPRKNPINSTL